MIQLSLPVQDSSWIDSGKDTLDVKVLVLYPYYVEADANGNSFDIKKEDVQAIHDNYNKTVRFKWSKLQKMGKDIPLKYVEHAANLLDHEPKATNVTGRVIGELEIVEKGSDPYLFAKLRVKGKENVERVKDGRFSQVSIGFDPKSHELFEISWVVNGAIPGAQAIMSERHAGHIHSDSKKNLDYNMMNVVNLKSVLLSQYEKNKNKYEENKEAIEIEAMLTSLEADEKILPRDRIRIKSELSRISDKQVRFSTFNLLSENLRNVIDYSVVSRNNLAINWEESLMSRKSNGVLDLEVIAANAAAYLKKGKKAKFDSTPAGEEYEEKEGHMSKEEKKEMNYGAEDDKKLSKKALKHCMSLSEDKEALHKYLSTFLSDEEDTEMEEDEDKEKKEEKEKGKFSKEVKVLNDECAELKKQNADILEKIAVLSKGTEESRALFTKIVDAYNTSK